MTIYGTVRFNWLGTDHVASLTPEGWRVEPPDAGLAHALQSFADPADLGPAAGDPMARAVIQVADLFRGTYELADLPKLPAGTVY